MSAESWKAVRFAGIALSIFWALGSAFILVQSARFDGRLAHDFAVYWRVANEPFDTVYAPGQKPFPYAPTAILFTLPLAFVSKMTGYYALSAIGIVGFVTAFRKHVSTAALALAMICPPMVRCIRNGQISAVMAALVMWSCATRHRIAAGAALGVVAAIKPQFVLMAPLMLLLNRDWRALVSSAAAFGALVVVSLGFGLDRWAEWIDATARFQEAVPSYKILPIGITPSMAAQLYGLPPTPFLILGALVGATLVWAAKDGVPLERATAIGAGSLLASPYALAYDLVIILPYLAALVWRGRGWAALGLMTAFHPLPLTMTAFELQQGRKGSPALPRVNVKAPRRDVAATAGN